MAMTVVDCWTDPSVLEAAREQMKVARDVRAE
jgi:hypothetical protein